MKRFFASFVLLFLLSGLVMSSATVAQEFGGFGFGNEAPVEDPVTLTSEFTVNKGTRIGTLSVSAMIAENWHVYSTTQPKGGPNKTVMTVVETDQFKTVGKFTPDSDPHVVEKDPVFKVRVEDFEFAVTWSIAIELAEGVDPNDLEIVTKFAGQTCVTMPDGTTGECRQIAEDLNASFAGFVESADPNEKFQPTDSHVLFVGKIINKKGGAIQAGETVQLQITAEPQDSYHVYAYSDSKPEAAEINPTMIGLTKTNGWKVSEPVTDAKLVAGKEGGLDYHDQPVTWTVDIDIPNDAEDGIAKLGGVIGFQTCTESLCDKPSSIKFTADIPLGQNTELVSVSFEDGSSYSDAVTAIAKAKSSQVVSAGDLQGYSLAVVLVLAFFAGLILNIMPCVLPVIGLKIMSFVSQAGENKFRVFMLNFVFALGLIFVFLILATLAAFFGYGWGELYTSTTFKVVMISVVFVFGLSFFGVWEIPIPGFVTTSGSGMAEKEGLPGAFFKGILTTLLATPCSGPLLIPVVIWAIAQPALVTYLVFFVMGLGMAAPYLVIGVFPSLMSFLPRPGKWMETFKELMGFILMGTVVFFVNSVGEKYMLSVLCLLVFLSLACWWIGRIGFGEKLSVRAKGWTAAGVITAIGIWFSFFLLIPQHELEWQTYSQAAVQQNLKEGNIVFVDFTADW